MPTKLTKILTDEELSRLEVSSETLPWIDQRIRSRLYEDERDECWSDLARHFIEHDRFDEAEMLVANISEDWMSIAVELLADCASGQWSRQNRSRSHALFVRALRLSRGCHEWQWVEAESLIAVAKAARRMKLLDLEIAILKEAAELAGHDAGLADGLRSLDARGILRKIALQLAEVGQQQLAVEVAGKIASPEMRQGLLEELKSGESSRK